jgi:hypothetical protein
MVEVQADVLSANIVFARPPVVLVLSGDRLPLIDRLCNLVYIQFLIVEPGIKLMPKGIAGGQLMIDFVF